MVPHGSRWFQKCQTGQIGSYQSRLEAVLNPAMPAAGKAGSDGSRASSLPAVTRGFSRHSDFDLASTALLMLLWLLAVGAVARFHAASSLFVSLYLGVVCFILQFL
jgi:hypothetical protein